MEQALSGDLGWHMAMLLDEVRVNWFARAIAASVRPGDVVLDLGTGTGLLAMLAARAGARRVYAVEQSPIADVAWELIAVNGLSDIVTIVPGLSFDIELPERADVVVSETLGAWGADEGIAAIMADAGARLATPEARFIPDGLTMWLAPLTTTAPAALHLAALGLDLDPLFKRLMPAEGGGGQVDITPSRVLAPAQAVLALALGRDNPRSHATTLDFALPSTTSADAVGGWFTASAPGVGPLSTSPSDPRTMWGQVVAPLPAPIGGALRVSVSFTFGHDGMEVDLQATQAQAPA